MPIRRRHVAAALAVATVLGGHSSAFATTSARTSTNTCSITARPPTLNARKQLTGSISVTCTAATVVTVDLTVIEIDGTTEDPRVLMVPKSFSTTVRARTAMTISTNTATCISTESGNEEYATKGRVNISGVVSAWDRTVPLTDSFAC
jgi:hypothetical protein